MKRITHDNLEDFFVDEAYCWLPSLLITDLLYVLLGFGRDVINTAMSL